MLHARCYSTARPATTRWQRPLFIFAAASTSFVTTFYYLSQGNASSQRARPLSNSYFIPLKILHKEMITPTTVLIDIESNERPKFLSAIWIKDPSMQIQRPYTPISFDPLRILVKRYDDGEVSRFVHKQGREFQVRGFDMTWNGNTEEVEILFIAGGTGITPALQLLETGRKLKVLYASKPGEVYDKVIPANADVEYFIDTKRRIGLADIQKWEKSTRGKERVVLVSGPDGMVKSIAGSKNRDGSQGDVGGLLRKAGLTSAEVFKL